MSVCGVTVQGLSPWPSLVFPWVHLTPFPCSAESEEPSLVLWKCRIEGGVAKAVPDVLPETHSLETSHQASSLRPLPCSFQSK